jgi:hypothetical protein
VYLFVFGERKILLTPFCGCGIKLACYSQGKHPKTRSATEFIKVALVIIPPWFEKLTSSGCLAQRYRGLVGRDCWDHRPWLEYPTRDSFERTPEG